VPSSFGCCRLTALLLVGTAAACGAGGAGRAEFAVRDSAGIRIADNSAAAEARLLDWSFPPDPDLVIGVTEGDPELQLFRVAGARQLGDGRIAVVNAGTQEIRYFDGHGRFLRGGGPGEYQFPTYVRGATSDELLIWDLQARRFTLLDAEGRVSRTVTPAGTFTSAAGWAAGPTVLVQRSGASAGLGTPEGIMSNDITYEILDLDRSEILPLDVLPGARVFHAQTGNQISFTGVPFDAAPSAAAAADGFVLTPGRTAELRVYTADGTLRRIIRVDRTPDPLPRPEFDAFVEERIEAATPEMQPELRRRYTAMPLPAAYPIYTSLLVDDAGRIWARRFSRQAQEPVAWSVFDPSGRALGTVTMPAGLTVHQIGEDFVLGVRRDALGVEQVVRFAQQR
jgi:hypothetical protein